MSTLPKNTADVIANRAARPSQLAASLSGAHWAKCFLGSEKTHDLAQPFRRNVDAFIGALRDAGAKVAVSATRRDPRRAYLMHWAWKIARTHFDPAKVPPMDGVSITWAHLGGDGKISQVASVAAAREMVRAFGMQTLGVAPSLKSRHTSGRAIDMSIRWNGTLTIFDAKGKSIEIKTLPRSGANRALHRVGASYGVIKYNRAGRDDPHWSDDGA